ncbi:PH domain-containing protein [Treponema pectinovorum]|uniref:PH domain-containing protein n=1 Tax=Treponema pectinovorum TaxID=164 RepID=UPI0011C98B87|nr:PH domain-containing protein [Treponema pectinovorum]
MKFSMTQPTNISNMIIIFAILTFFVFISIVLISARFYKIEITDKHFMIKGLVYNTSLELAEIDVDNVRLINMNEEQIKMDMRTNGIGLPGLLVGWFKSDGEKYKLYVTDKENVLYIPTKKGYTILISTHSGKEILEELRKQNY